MGEVKYVIAATLLFFGIPYGTWADKATTKVLGENDEIEACISLFKPEYAEQECCENLSSVKKFDDEIKECAKSASSDEWTCTDFECFFRKKGILDGKGKIIDEKMKSMFDEIVKEYPKEKKSIDLVTKECLNGQYEEYPPDEDCDALKFYVCAYTNTMLVCDSWKDTKICKEVSELAKTCREATEAK